MSKKCIYLCRNSTHIFNSVGYKSKFLGLRTSLEFFIRSQVKLVFCCYTWVSNKKQAIPGYPAITFVDPYSMIPNKLDILTFTFQATHSGKRGWIWSLSSARHDLLSSYFSFIPICSLIFFVDNLVKLVLF
jgi:hypothetical protein